MYRKNILFILPFFPYPLISGGHQALFNGIKILKDKANVYILYEENSDEDCSTYYNIFQQQIGFPITIFKYKKIVPIELNKSRVKQYIKKVVSKINNTIFKKKEDIPYVYIRNTPWGEMSRDRYLLVNKIIEHYNIDIVQCEMLDTIGYVYHLPLTVKKVFVHHELGFVKEEYYVKSLYNNTVAFKERLQVSRKYEIDALNLYDTIVTLSSIDAKKLKTAGVYKDIISSCCSIVRSEIRNSDTTKYNPFELTFVGSGNHPPNIDGLRWFLNNCWGHLIKSDSRYHLSIVGLWTKDSICKLYSCSKNKYSKVKRDILKQNIFFKGYVDNISILLNQSISIVPIQYGSGVRIKILEAAFSYSPIVSTHMGAEGIPLASYNENNKEKASCILADTSIDFVNGIVKLQNKELKDILTTNAFAIVNKYYSLDSLAKSRISIYQ